ncbi:MAG TPA: sensor domain-containing diguanylate cyclase [Longimicrobiaceae bacterium]|jgi:diguanylate cyclase (GGDEF)-like protein|nr:sensor domain-containing diguanylate cyclase [Longimicrobiaceae bacterium]
MRDEAATAALPGVHPAAQVALAFAAVPLQGAPDAVAAACVEAARRVTGGPAWIGVPTRPVPLSVGDAREGLAPLLRFPAPGGEGELWVGEARAAALPADVRDAVAGQMERIWQIQEQRAAQALELDQLRFHLTALQQVARTLAVVRGAEETERLVLDSVGEVFFAWWAALYHTDGEQYTCRAVRSLRGESVAYAIPARVVRQIAAPGEPPVIPSEDAEIRDHVPAEVAVVAPLDFGDGGAGLLILGKRMTEAPYEPHDLALLRALADSSAIALRNAELVDRLRAQATIDPLTGCHNRRGFDEILTVEFARAKRHGRPLSVVLLDIDHFKHVNDDFGHEVGDHALQRIGRAVRHAFQTSDSACRYGGEEFALIFPEKDKEEAKLLAERLRLLIESLPPNAEVPRAMTASFGLASFPDDAGEPADLIRAADRALYQAKARGRNRVEAA